MQFRNVNPRHFGGPLGPLLSSTSASPLPGPRRGLVQEKDRRFPNQRPWHRRSPERNVASVAGSPSHPSSRLRLPGPAAVARHRTSVSEATRSLQQSHKTSLAEPKPSGMSSPPLPTGVSYPCGLWQKSRVESMLPESSLSQCRQCRQCPSCTSRSRGPKPPWKPPAWAETGDVGTAAFGSAKKPRSAPCLPHRWLQTSKKKCRCRVGLSSPPMSPMLWGPGAMALATLVPSSAGVCGATCRLGLGRVMARVGNIQKFAGKTEISVRT